jgi:hypothetical protein
MTTIRKIYKGRYWMTGMLLVILLISACKKDDYYLDSGKLDPHYNGTILDYLKDKPFYFDTLVSVIQLAGMEDVFTKDTITFFAPTDHSIKSTLDELNGNLYAQGKDTIKTLQEVAPEVWKKYLSIYIFKGRNELKDYPQIDFELLRTYPGQNYASYNNTVMNIGVVYGSANDVKYVGYRQLYLNYIIQPAQVPKAFSTAPVASSNIMPLNGVIHVLSDNHFYFGFSPYLFINDYEIYNQQ